MTLGMIVRADFGRGLAQQTYSFWRHLKPDVTVVIDMSEVQGARPYDWPQDFDAYPGAIQTKWKGYTADFENPQALAALSDCDIVFSAETYYDERLPERTRTILHVNPELFRHQKATQYWYPTPWRINDLPPGHLVPTPIEDEDIALDLPGTNKLLHVGGHRAAGDRNGTQIIGGTIRHIDHPWRLTAQDGMKMSPRVRQRVEVKGNTENRWELYDGCGILVYPRRYGGQSLVVNEAMARGLAVVMGDNPPNIEAWPVVPAPTRAGGYIKTPGGRIQMHMVLTQSFEDVIRTLLSDDEMLQRWQARSLAWARDNAWSEWEPKIRELVDAR